jgi:hypothetical protein
MKQFVASKFFSKETVFRFPFLPYAAKFPHLWSKILTKYCPLIPRDAFQNVVFEDNLLFKPVILIQKGDILECRRKKLCRKVKLFIKQWIR